MYDSIHFKLESLADGVYAAMSTYTGGTPSNNGIVDLGDRVIIFDTSLTPQAAADLRAAAETVTGRPVGLAINSHYHADHVQGNQVFEDVEIYATALTQARITAPDRESTLSEIKQTIAELEQQRLTLTDAEARQERTVQPHQETGIFNQVSGVADHFYATF
jgi:glyoxylase-like metal-dependent hydrolase (beta-lactamase superfamily II)